MCHVARKEEIQIIRAAKEKVCLLLLLLLRTNYDFISLRLAGNGSHLRGVPPSFVPVRGRSRTYRTWPRPSEAIVGNEGGSTSSLE